MDSYRVQKAVEARANEWLGIPKRDVHAHFYQYEGGQGLDDGEWLFVDLNAPLGWRETDALHRWIAYLDWITDGRITVNATAAQEIELHRSADERC